MDFVALFERHYSDEWPQWIDHETIDLVFESACDAKRSNPEYDLGVLDEFVATAAPRSPERIRDWTSADWAVAPYLRAIVH